MVGCQCPRLSACNLARSRALRPNRRDDQPHAVRRNVQLSFRSDPKQLENRLVDDDARAVADGLETLDHAHVITPFTTPRNAISRLPVRRAPRQETTRHSGNSYDHERGPKSKRVYA